MFRFFTLFAFVATAFAAPVVTDIKSSGHGLTAAVASVETELQSAFSSWKSQYNVKYAAQEEHEMRFSIFKQNVDKINTHNRLNAGSWTMGINQFADLTKDEFAKKMLQPRGTFKREGPLRVGDSNKGNNATYVDWVAKGVVLPVRNQEQCGSCWAFSATGSAASAYAMKHNTKPLAPSVQQVVSCDQTSNGCGGGSMDSAFTYIISNGGLESATAYPYTSGTGDSGTCQASGPYNALTLTSYKDVPSNDVKELLAELEVAPVSVAVDASNWQFYSGGVFDSRHCSSSPDSLDHGVLAVGFDKKSGWLKIQNSWAAQWGEEGYIRLDIGTGWFLKNPCGVADMASRPIA